MYTGVCRTIFEAEGGVERELAKRENEMGSPVDETVWARDEMSFRENIKTLCIAQWCPAVNWVHASEMGAYHHQLPFFEADPSCLQYRTQ